MRQDYKTTNEMTVGKKKNYLLSLDLKADIQEKLYDCMNDKQLERLLSDQRINKLFFIQALKALYQVTDYEQLEYHLIMMNHLFTYQSYEDLKNQLLEKICKKSITINEYCVLRQLVDFEHIPFSKLIDKLHDVYEVDYEECARICLLEDQYHLAYLYLSQLNECQDECLLDLLCSYSIYDYTRLIRHYAKEKRRYTLLPTH